LSIIPAIAASVIVGEFRKRRLRALAMGICPATGGGNGHTKTWNTGVAPTGELIGP